jgi:hypothetical protein
MATARLAIRRTFRGRQQIGSHDATETRQRRAQKLAIAVGSRSSQDESRFLARHISLSKAAARCLLYAYDRKAARLDQRTVAAAAARDNRLCRSTNAGSCCNGRSLLASFVVCLQFAFLWASRNH